MNVFANEYAGKNQTKQESKRRDVVPKKGSNARRKLQGCTGCSGSLAKMGSNKGDIGLTLSFIVGLKPKKEVSRERRKNVAGCRGTLANLGSNKGDIGLTSSFIIGLRPKREVSQERHRKRCRSSWEFTQNRKQHREILG